MGFDIETDTTNGGLEPDTAAIVAVAVSIRWATHPAAQGSPVELVQPQAGPAEQVLTGAEDEILRGVDHLLESIPTGYLVTWNGASFDLPFVARRAEMLGLEIGLEVAEDPARRSRREPDRSAVRGSWHDLVHLDGYLLYRADVGTNLGISCGLKPLARLVSWSVAGVGPEVMGIGPVYATRRLCDQQHLQLEDFDTIELNEAFAAQSLACIAELDLNLAQVNVDGGAIALGHPIGASGARLIVHLAHRIASGSSRHGLATMCVGGGLGAAVTLTRCE